MCIGRSAANGVTSEYGCCESVCTIGHISLLVDFSSERISVPTFKEVSNDCSPLVRCNSLVLCSGVGSPSVFSVIEFLIVDHHVCWMLQVDLGSVLHNGFQFVSAVIHDEEYRMSFPFLNRCVDCSVAMNRHEQLSVEIPEQHTVSVVVRSDWQRLLLPRSANFSRSGISHTLHVFLSVPTGPDHAESSCLSSEEERSVGYRACVP